MMQGELLGLLSSMHFPCSPIAAGPRSVYRAYGFGGKIMSWVRQRSDMHAVNQAMVQWPSGVESMYSTEECLREIGSVRLEWRNDNRAGVLFYAAETKRAFVGAYLTVAVTARPSGNTLLHVTRWRKVPQHAQVMEMAYDVARGVLHAGVVLDYLRQELPALDDLLQDSFELVAR